MSSPPESPTETERRALLGLAREAIREAVCQGRLLGLPDWTGALAELCGAFVTLHRHGRLRGCIGQITRNTPLGETVARCAVSSALQDPRFPPVTPEELKELEIEISVLSPLERIQPGEIEVGRHGLLISHEGRRGLLLPQVPVEHRWSREQFLEETCLKAGLSADAWKDPAAQIEGFTAEVFSDADFSPARRTAGG